MFYIYILNLLIRINTKESIYETYTRFNRKLEICRMNGNILMIKLFNL